MPSQHSGDISSEVRCALSWNTLPQIGRPFPLTFLMPQSEFKKGHSTIYPEAESYAHALQLGGLHSLDNSRNYLLVQQIYDSNEVS